MGTSEGFESPAKTVKQGGGMLVALGIALGILVGIHVLMSGWAAIMLGVEARGAASEMRA